MLETYGAYHEIVGPVLAALALFFGVLSLGWPYLGRDNFKQRMRLVSDGRERDRLRDKVRLKAYPF
jgi:tight adherence protein C